MIKCFRNNIIRYPFELLNFEKKKIGKISKSNLEAPNLFNGLLIMIIGQFMTKLWDTYSSGVKGEFERDESNSLSTDVTMSRFS